MPTLTEQIQAANEEEVLPYSHLREEVLQTFIPPTQEQKELLFWLMDHKVCIERIGQRIERLVIDGRAVAEFENKDGLQVARVLPLNGKHDWKLRGGL